MRQHCLVPPFLFIFLISCPLTDQPTSSSDSTSSDRLAAILRLPVLTPQDWQTLFSEANTGNPEAQYWLGRVYGNGILLPKDPDKSAMWYQKSADQGYPRAQYAVCVAHANSETFENERCMRRAAESGVPEAQFWLGVAFDQHLWFGVSDQQEALKWFKQAAEGGNPDAQVELASRYMLGDGLEQNHALAAEWFLKAAEHIPNLGGAGQGRYHLGLLYMEGDGVPKDYVQAYMWFTVAEFDQFTAQAAEKMTPAQILQAQQLAAAWKTQHPIPAIY
jgi:TPR repeat protein